MISPDRAEKIKSEILNKALLSVAIALPEIYARKTIAIEQGGISVETLELSPDTVRVPTDLSQVCERLRQMIEPQLPSDFWGGILNQYSAHLDQLRERGTKQPGKYLTELYAKNITDQIFRHMEFEKFSLAELERLLEVKVDPLAEAPLFQTRKVEPMATSAIVLASLQAQLRKDKWERDASGLAYFQYPARNPSNIIEHYISSLGDIKILPWEEARQIIDKFGFETAKLHVILAAYATHSHRPWEGTFHLKGSDIIRLMGWNRRHYKSKSENLRKIANTALALSCLLATATWEEGKSSQGRVNASFPTGRVWEILVQPQAKQLNLDFVNKDEIDFDEVFLTVRPGLWTQHFLNKAGSEARQALYQFGYLAESTLKIDPYHDELALRLALKLTAESRYKRDGKYRVSTILQDILPTAKIEKARSDSRRSYDLRTQWLEAIQLLASMGWQIHYGDNYPIYLQPNPDPATKRPKGNLLNMLLDATIIILPPKPIPDLLAATKKPPSLPANTRKKRTSLTGADVRKAREAKGWSQRELAGKLAGRCGKGSQSLVWQIENNGRSINSELEAALRKLLDFQE